LKWEFRITFVLSFTLLWALTSQRDLGHRTFYRWKKESPSFYVEKAKKNLRNHGKIASLDNAINVGYKRKLPRKWKKSFKNLGLLHLFTPSGLHLYPFYFLITFLFNRFISISVLSAIFLLILNTGDFFALRRIALMKASALSLSFIIKKNPFLYAFFLAFFIDFCWGSFKDSPLGFTFSFTFLSLLIIKEPKYPFYYKIILGQILIAYFLNQNLNIAYCIIGIGLSSIFSLVFPIIFLNFWCDVFTWQKSVSFFLLEKLLLLVQKTEVVFANLPTFQLNFLLIYALFFYQDFRKAIPLIILFYT
jgi:competence protein ComEC